MDWNLTANSTSAILRMKIGSDSVPPGQDLNLPGRKRLKSETSAPNCANLREKLEKLLL